jgi:hypothetical protein
MIYIHEAFFFPRVSSKGDEEAISLPWATNALALVKGHVPSFQFLDV